MGIYWLVHVSTSVPTTELLNLQNSFAKPEFREAFIASFKIIVGGIIQETLKRKEERNE